VSARVPVGAGVAGKTGVGLDAGARFATHAPDVGIAQLAVAARVVARALPAHVGVAAAGGAVRRGDAVGVHLARDRSAVAGGLGAAPRIDAAPAEARRRGRSVTGARTLHAAAVARHQHGHRGARADRDEDLTREDDEPVLVEERDLERQRVRPRKRDLRDAKALEVGLARERGDVAGVQGRSRTARR
jgi:hypothetical protein